MMLPHHPKSLLLFAAFAWGMAAGLSSLEAQTPEPPQARTGRFKFGSGEDPTHHLFVIPLDFQKGVQLSHDEEAPWAEGQPWGYYPWYYKIAGSRKHLIEVNSGVVTYPTEILNPVAGFGGAGGGSSMYIGQTFRFAVHTGGQSAATDVANELKILVYDRAAVENETGVSPIYVENIDLPHTKEAAASGSSTDWRQFGDNGYQKTVVTSVNGVPVLETTVQFAIEGDASGSWGARYFAPLILTHRALPGAEPYGFVIEAVGMTQVGEEGHWMAVSDPNEPDITGAHVRAYAMNFEQAPPWMSTLVTTPNFQGEPAPPTYHGKTAEEIENIEPRFEHQFAAPTSGQYTTLSDKPELQAHALLDKFVAEMGNDPMALANYVHNEIGLTDALGYNQNGDIDDTSVNAGGMNRGALATFMEGQGSPEEQSALLVYLLRKAGVPAAYVKPSHNAVEMLDQRLSNLLRMRLKGLQTPEGSQPVPQMIGINYPWVTAYVTIDGMPQWVHLFPWLKDTEVVEGLPVESYLPSGTKSVREWVRKYLLADANDPLWQLDEEDHTPGNIFQKDLEKFLQDNWQGLSVDNLGIRFRDRRFNRSKWDQFPQPTRFDTTNGIFTLTETLSPDAKLYDTMDIEIASVQNPAKKITVNGLRVMDMHNRRTIVNFIPGTPNNFTLKFTTEAYDLANPGSGTNDFTYGADSYLRKKQEKTLAVNTSDKQFTFKVTYHRHQSYDGAVGAADQEALGGWNHFLGITNIDFNPNSAATASQTTTSTFNLGDLNAFCLNTGRVTDKMLKVHLEPFWQHEQARAIDTNLAPDYDLIQGATAYLMGMSYYQRVSRSFERMKDIFKVHVISMKAHGFAQFGARKDGSGNPVVVNAPLVNSQTTPRVDQAFPVVDMNFSRVAWAGYGDVRPDAGGQGAITGVDFMTNLFIAEISSLEDHTIQQYVNVVDTDAVSTVNLIHRVQQDGNAGTNVIELNADNLLTEKAKSYTFEGQTKTLGEWAGGLWSSIEDVFAGWDKNLARVYITPGPVAGAEGHWKGMGALIIGKTSAGALIGQLNGGAGNPPFLNNSFNNLASFHWGNSTIDLSIGGSAQMNYSSSFISTTPAIDYYTSPGNTSSSAWMAYGTNLAQGNSYMSYVDSVYSGSYGQTGIGLQESFLHSVSAPSIVSSWTSNFDVFGTSITSSGWSTTFADPVHSITGELYADEVDLVLPGPIPLQVRRNYSSQSTVMGHFGYGWKMAYFPFIAVTDDGDRLQVAELDGSVIIYTRNTDNIMEEEWTVLPEDNPQLTNGSGMEIGSVRNLFRNRIVRTNGGVTYTLHAADGGTREYETRSYPVYGASPAISRERPYLKRWTDAVGNHLDFKFYGDGVSGDPWYVTQQHSSYGQLARVQASNGNYLGFNYDIFGRILEIYTGDGRRVAYRYDEYGDLRDVTMPDGSWARYDYVHEQGKVGETENLAWYSTHLISRETRPGGRMVESDYELYAEGDLDPEGVAIGAGSDKIGKASHKRRVIEQRATVGEHAGGENRTVPAAESYKPVRNGTYTYYNTEDEDGMITGRTEILDAYNRKTIYYYVNNRLTKVFDPLSVVTDATAGTGSNAKMEQEWWTEQDVTNNVPGAFAGGLKSMQQRGSARTEFYYSGAGDVTEIRVLGDLDGDGADDDTAVTTATYNSLHLPELITHPDPATGAATGKRTRYYYEDVSRPYLVTKVEHQDPSGNVLSATTHAYHDVFSNPGNQTQVPFSKGLLQERKVAAGTADESVTEWDHDARGFPIQQVAESGHLDQTNYPNMITEFFHNLRGELVEERVMDGATAKKANRYAYDDMGRRIWAERLNESGQQIAWDYSYYTLTGEIEWTDSSRSNPEDYTYMRYDGAGRPVEQVAWRSRAKADGTGVEAVPGIEQYATTKFFYNQFGDLIKVMDPRGHTVRAYYDDIGRQTATQAYQGDWQNGGTLLAQEQTSYDDAARKINKLDVRGGVTQTWFTSNGRPRRQQNPDGTVLEWRYQLDGRVLREPVNAHVYVKYTYDDTNRTITKTTKNLDSQTLGSEVVQADRRGNAVSATNMVGHTVTSTYDKLNRVITQSIPAAGASSEAQSSTYYYDAAGMRQKVVNALGESSETLSDALGRMLNSVTRDASDNIVSQSSASYTADFHGVTTTTGTDGNALTQSTWTDNAGRTVLVKHADGTYRRIYYDAAGNAYSTTDEQGNTTTSEYDGMNRVTKTILPDGAQTQFVYSYPGGGGERVERHMPQNLKEVEIFDAAGRISEKYLSGAGDIQTRHYQNYGYYNSGKNKGLLGQFTDSRGLVNSFAYDDWLRLSSATIGSPGTTAYVKKEFLGYDVRGMVTHLQETGYYAVTDVLNSYDGQGHLVEEEVRINGNAVNHLVNHYDAAGRRDSLDRGNAVPDLGSGVGGSWGFGYRADGLMSQVSSAGGTFNYTYGDSGLLQTRSNPFRSYTVPNTGGRDNRGRLLAATTRLSGHSVDVLSEVMSWTQDNKQSSYTATRLSDPNNAGSSPTWNDVRSYVYTAQRRQLVSESWVPGEGQSSKTQYYEHDYGQSGGLGVHTGRQTTAPAGSSGDQMWLVSDESMNGGGQDAFARVIQEVSGHEQLLLTAQGTAKGAKQVELMLQEQEKLANTQFPAATRFSSGAWSKDLWLPGGSYQLDAGATHPSGEPSPPASAAFNVGLRHFTVETVYDDDGNVTQRHIGGGVAQGGRTQTLTWDGVGRLIRVVQEEFGGYGYEWSAVYDGQNRRLQATHIPKRGGIAQPNEQVVERSWYDPLVEFLEVGIEVIRGSGSTASTQRWWKVHGPDLSGGYGGLEGMGGLEALIQEATGEVVGTIDDNYGHIVGFVKAATFTAASNGTFSYEWHSVQFGGYGPLPGQWTATLSDNTQIWRLFGWRGKRLDPTGYYHLGARYYEPTSGRFLSTDPMGHDASMSLYDYAGGDPINFVDPRGRSAAYGWDSPVLSTPNNQGSSGYWQATYEGGEIWVPSAAGSSNNAPIGNQPKIVDVTPPAMAPSSSPESSSWWDKFTSAASAAGEWTADFGTGIVDGAGGMAEGIWSAVSSPVQTAKGAWNGITTEVDNWSSSIEGYMISADQGTFWADLGGGARDGLYQGVQDLGDGQKFGQQWFNAGVSVIGGAALRKIPNTARTGGGTIYKVPGTATPSGKPYIGRHNKPEPQKTRASTDGRDRTQAEVIDTYDSSKPMEGRIKEQAAIDAEGGVPNLDNKRNEIRKKK